MHKLELTGMIDMNCYFIVRNGTCYIVDPGYNKEGIIDYVNSNNWKVKGILLTHAHVDHIGAVDCFDVPIYMHEKEYSLFVDNRTNGAALFGMKMPYSPDDVKVIKITEKDVIPLGDKQIKIIHTPGHTAGSVCYKIENELYSGDTLFKHEIGRCDLPTGDYEEMKITLVRLLDSLDDAVLVYPGHGDSTSIGDEKLNNPYYIEWKNS